MSDSVGKISLDLEVKSDLGKQINVISNAISKNLKNTLNNATKGAFDNMCKNADASIKNVSNTLNNGLKKIKQNISSTLSNAFSAVKNFKMPKINFPKPHNNIKPTSNTKKTTNFNRGPPIAINKEALSAEISNVSATLDNVNASIEQQKQKLAQLKEAYNTTFNDNRKNKIAEKILKTESRINSLIAKSDKLGFKLAGLDEKMAGVGSNSVKAATGVNDLSKKTKNFTNKANNSIGVLKRFNGLFKNIGKSSKSTGQSFNGMNYGLQNTINQMFKWMIILPMIVKGLSAMASGLLANLKTNQQFATSLAQIKTNLMVAFTPIYEAILPAINALMSGLAKLTTYIASFTSAIFGKTYQQSYQATQQLIDAKKEMGAYGEAAKKTKKELGLAGFDEINLLNKNNDNADDSKVPKLVQPPLDTSQVDNEMNALADKIKNIFSQIFAPMKAAWDKEGKATVDAFKYALGQVLQLTKDIGKSFLNVWTNGTGQKVCENILKLLQTILNIIGDIAKAFDTAWNKGNLGTKVIQAMFNSLNSVLELLGVIGNTFRKVWNDGTGVEICTNILEILKNIFTITGQIADSFKNAWSAGLGKEIITDILNLLNGCLRIIKDITASFSNAWITNGDTICNGILLILDDIFGTLSDITNAWANAWENNGNGDALMNSLLESLGKIFTTIGDIGKGIRESIGNVAEDVFGALIQFCTDVNNGFGAIADGLKIIWDNGGQHLFNGIVNLIAKVSELVLKITGGAFKDASSIFKDILAPAIGEVFNVVGTLVDKLAEFTNWINNNKPLIDILSATLAGIGAALAGAKIASLVSVAVEALSTLGTILGSVFSGGIISGIVELGAALVAAVGGWPVIIGAAIVAIGVLIYKNWDEISSWLSNKWQWLSNTCSQIWGGIKDFLAQWGIDILAFIVGGPIALVGVEIAKHWDEVKEKTTEIWTSVSTWLGTTWESVKNTCSETWDNIKTSISDKWGEVTQETEDTWNNLTTWLGTTWGNINTSAATSWETIKTSISGKWTELKDKCSEIWTNIKTEFDNVITWVKTTFTTGWSNAWNGVKNIFTGVFNGLLNVAKKPLNAIITMINKIIDGLNSINLDIPDWVPGVGGESFGINIPKIPALAKGGILDSPTLSMVGEAGKEAVMPLENNTGWITELANKIAGIIGTSAGSVNTQQQGGDIIFMIDGSVIGKVALKELRKMQRQGNVTLIPT